MATQPRIVIVIRAVVRGNSQVSGFVRLVETVAYNRSMVVFKHAVRHKWRHMTSYNDL